MSRPAAGRPGGCAASPSTACAGVVSVDAPTRRQGNHTVYAPGVVELRPRLTPTHALGSMRLFEKACRGLTGYARQPNGGVL
eukprot:6195233-Pleurochrysis_carterae.AAC.3